MCNKRLKTFTPFSATIFSSFAQQHTESAQALSNREYEMKKLVIGTLFVLTLLSVATASVYAAPTKVKTNAVGPYEGTFHGTAYGDYGSSAPMTLELTHRGDRVEGYVSLGQGLNVNGRFCGSSAVPADTLYARGRTESTNPHRLTARSTFEVQGMDITADLESNVSVDGNTIAAKVRLDLPWFCGRDPVLTGTLHKS
jgi:opacity protein-like surface antigen